MTEFYKHQGTLARAVNVHEFMGLRMTIAEKIDRYDTATISLFSSFEEWEPATADEWNVALRRAEKAKAKRNAEARAKAEGEAHGFEVRTSSRYSGPFTRYIVRATATLFVDSQGEQYSRKDGYQRGQRSSPVSIEKEDMAKLHEFVGDRQVVDIVAERKAAQSCAEPR